MRCVMSNFTVNGVYSYTSANIYSYLGRVPSSSTKLEEAFDEFNITPTGSTDDLKKLDRAMYAEYSEQVQNQIENQKGEKVVPWAGLCAQIGVKATGDYEKDINDICSPAAYGCTDEWSECPVPQYKLRSVFT